MRRALLLGTAFSLLVGLAQATTVYEVYRVQADDTVESIASRYGMKPTELRDLNPFLRGGSLTPNELITVMLRQSEAVGLGGGGTRRSSSFNGDNGAGGIRSSSAPQVVEETVGPAGAVTQENVPPAVNPAPAPAAATPASGGDRNFAVNGSLGRLGMVSAEKAPIFRQRNENSSILFSCQRNTRLAVTRQLDGWDAVMMVDGSTGWVPAQYVTITDQELVNGPAAAGSARGQAVIQQAYRYLGVPYLWGGEGFGGIDCSGLVLQCYRSQGVHLPRTAAEQATVGQAVRWDQLQPGDRLYFSSDGGRIDHTGMYLGQGRFIHASGRRRQVGIDNLFDSRYWSIYVGARR